MSNFWIPKSVFPYMGQENKIAVSFVQYGARFWKCSRDYFILGDTGAIRWVCRNGLTFVAPFLPTQLDCAWVDFDWWREQERGQEKASKTRLAGAVLIAVVRKTEKPRQNEFLTIWKCLNWKLSRMSCHWKRLAGLRMFSRLFYSEWVIKALIKKKRIKKQRRKVAFQCDLEND